MEENKVKIRKFIGRFYGQHALQDDENLFELGFVNSLFAMQLVNFIEKDFGVSISNQDLDLKNFSSINQIDQFIQQKAAT